VARIIVLDSGPLGDACRRRGSPEVEELRGKPPALARIMSGPVPEPKRAIVKSRRGTLAERLASARKP
jgi:hypothetical protein